MAIEQHIMFSKALEDEEYLVPRIQTLCRPRNVLENVSSVLFVSDGHFLQLIEGEMDGPVCRTIERMINDDGHVIEWVHSFVEPRRAFVKAIPFLVIYESEQISSFFDVDEWERRRRFHFESAVYARHFLFRLVMATDPILLSPNIEPLLPH